MSDEKIKLENNQAVPISAVANGDGTFDFGVRSKPYIGQVVTSIVNPDPTKFLSLEPSPQLLRSAYPTLSAMQPIGVFGQNWVVRRPLLMGASAPIGIAYGLVNSVGTWLVSWGGIMIFRSTDLVNWLGYRLNVALNTATQNPLRYANGVFFALPTSGAVLQYSTDGGLTWTSVTVTGANGFGNIIYAAGLYVITSVTAGTAIYTSPDLVNWTAQTLHSSNAWASVAWNGTLFTVIKASGVASERSTDGVTWIANSDKSSGNWRTKLYCIGTKILAVGAAANTAYISVDGGQNWSTIVWPETSAGTDSSGAETTGLVCWNINTGFMVSWDGTDFVIYPTRHAFATSGCIVAAMSSTEFVGLISPTTMGIAVFPTVAGQTANIYLQNPEAPTAESYIKYFMRFA